MKHIVGLLVLSAVLCAVAPAKADRIDVLKSQDVSIYCSGEAQAFYDGFNYRVYGTERKFKNISTEEFEHKTHEDPPKDGMYYVDLDKYTKQEQDFINSHVLDGYDFATELIKKGTKIELGDSIVSESAQKYFEKCAQEEAARRVMPKTDNSSNLHRTASNQRFNESYDPNTPQQAYCTDVAVKHYNACMIGVNPVCPK